MLHVATRRALLSNAATLGSALAFGRSARAAGVASFYAGKQVRLVIGSDVGGPYDIAARLLGGHLGRHIPGSPTIVIENMPGATSVIAADYIDRVAPQDGTVMATIANIVPMAKALGQVKMQFDPASLSWIGNPAREVYTLYVRAGAPAKTIEDAKRIKLVMGATSRTAMSSMYPRLLDNLIGTKFHVVEGYAGAANVQLAMDRGEVDGFAGDSWNDGYGQGRSFQWYRDGAVRTLVVIATRRPPQLKDAPLLTDLSTDPETRAVLELFASPAEVGKPLVMGPGVPRDRVEAIRRAFLDTVTDPAFLADAARAKITIDPVPGAELESAVKAVMSTPEPVLARARAALQEQSR
jgi:tripartite-type tricarboxylate transporter receptor subunit TctC